MSRLPNASASQLLWYQNTLRVGFLAAVCLLTLISLFAGLIYYLPFPYTGFEFSNSVVGQLDKNGPVARAGIRLGDEIIAINGRLFATREGPYISPRAELATYTILREGRPQEIVVRFNSSLTDDAARKVMHYLAGFGFWILGGLILFLRTDDKRATLLILSCFIASLTLAVLPFADLGADWASRVVATLLMIVSPLFVHYHSAFPEQKSLRKRRRLVIALVYGVGLVLLLSRAPFSAGQLVEVGLFAPIGVLMRVFIVVCMVLGLALLVHTRMTTTNDLIRRQASLMTLGTGLSVLAMTVLVVIPQVVSGTYLLPTHFVFWLLFLIPMSYVYATYRHELMSIDPKVNRTVVMAVLAFVLMGIYWIVWEIITTVAPNFFPFVDSKTAGLIIALLIAFGIAPLQARIQRLVDTAFYGGWYDYRSIIQAVARNLNEIADMDHLSDQLVAGLVNDLHVKGAALILPDEKDQSLYVRKAIDFEPVRIPRDGILATYLTLHAEPIEHLQLVTDLKAAGLDATPELNAWHDAQLWVPLVKEGSLEGILVLGLKQVEDFFSREDRLILSTLAHQAAAAIQNVRLVETLRQQLHELKSLSNELRRARDEEQQRMARELHDSIIQDLLAMGHRLERGMSNPELQTRVIKGMRDDIDQIVATLRRVYRQLQHSLILEELGLTKAVQKHVERFEAEYSISVSVQIEPIETDCLSTEVQSCLYWTLQEALANVARHSHATHAAVTLSVSDTEAILEVRDYGRGFVVPDRFTQLAAAEHYGLTGLEQRAEILGGTLEIHSAPGRGTALCVCLPLMPITSSTLIVERNLEWNHGKPKY